MNDCHVNVRIGCWHYKMSFKYKLFKEYNIYHEDNPSRFGIYSFFGLEKTLLKMFNK